MNVHMQEGQMLYTKVESLVYIYSYLPLNIPAVFYIVHSMYNIPEVL
jgi:hypothetical protein